MGNEQSISGGVPAAETVPRDDVWSVAFAGAAVAAVILTDLIDFGADHLRIRLLDANVDSSWSHRATAAALAAGALLALARAVRYSSSRASWCATGGILSLLFVVEASPLHVHIDRLSYGKLIYAPLLLGLLVSLWRLVGSSDQAKLMCFGLAALFMSYAIHIFGMPVMHALRWGPNSWGYQTRAALKEGLELAGWLLVVVALWRLQGRRPGTSGTWRLSQVEAVSDDAR